MLTQSRAGRRHRADAGGGRDPAGHTLRDARHLAPPAGAEYGTGDSAWYGRNGCRDDLRRRDWGPRQPARTPSISIRSIVDVQGVLPHVQHPTVFPRPPIRPADEALENLDELIERTGPPSRRAHWRRRRCRRACAASAVRCSRHGRCRVYLRNVHQHKGSAVATGTSTGAGAASAGAGPFPGGDPRRDVARVGARQHQLIRVAGCECDGPRQRVDDDALRALAHRNVVRPTGVWLAAFCGSGRDGYPGRPPCCEHAASSSVDRQSRVRRFTSVQSGFPQGMGQAVLQGAQRDVGEATQFVDVVSALAHPCLQRRTPR